MTFVSSGYGIIGKIRIGKRPVSSRQIMHALERLACMGYYQKYDCLGAAGGRQAGMHAGRVDGELA